MVLLGNRALDLENSKLKLIAKLLLPYTVRQYLRSLYRAYVFRKALKKFIRNPSAALMLPHSTLSDLIYGWGNEAWSTSEEYAKACLLHALECNKPILECGSGLTTILLGVIAQKNNNKVWSIEHNTSWANRVNKVLTKYKITSAQVITGPLKDFGDFVWYDTPLQLLPSSFGLVVCDGPPGDIKGYRYGLLPIMKQRIMDDCIILLDDAIRDEEKEIAIKWGKELRCDFEIIGSQYPYIRFVIPSRFVSEKSILLDRVS